jgi:biopolymer transport protein ExbD
MADKQVRIVISAQDSFSSVMNKYSSAMGQATADTKQFDQAAQGSGAGVENLASTIGNAVKGFIAFKAVGMAAEMVTIGNAANATQATFTALSGGINQATNTLNALRAATGGVVADTELMAGANRLLAMNIATSGQQAADLAGVAVNLGKAFGQDASSAIENFSLMIANQSLLRLDSLGISAAAVRERMKELAAEFPEMDKQARFTQATLEQATVTVDRLGTSITAAQTPLAKLETSFENLKTTVSQSMATVVNDALTAAGQLATIFDLIGKNGLDAVANAAFNPENSLAQQRALPLADAGVEMFSEYLDMGGMNTTMTGLQMQEMLERAFTMVEENPALKSDWSKVVEEIIGSPFDPNSTAMVALRDSLSATYSIVTKEAAVNAENQSRELARFQAIMASQANPGMTFDQMQQQNYEAAKYGALTDQFGGTTGKGGSWFENTFGGAGDVAAAGELFTQLESAQASLAAFQGSAGGIGQFIDASTMEGINAQFEKLRELNEQGLITDDSLAKAEEFKTKAEAAAKAFENMSLTDIFGQSSGGVKGEIGDLVLERMKENGATPEELAAVQRQFDLSSGRETQSSLAFDEKVVPMLEQLALEDPAMAAQAIANFEESSKQAKLLGIDDATMANNIMGFTGMTGTGAGSSFTVAPWGSGNAQSTLGGNMGGISPAMAEAFKQKYGIELTPETFAAIQGMGTSTQFTAEDIQPDIQSTMLDTAMQAGTVNGFASRSKDEILADPAFQKAVADATLATLAQLNAPADAGGTGGGMSTLSEISAATGIPIATLLAATGADSPNLVQPGTYNVPGYGPMGNFDPLGYAQGLAGGYAPAMGTGGAAPSPFMTNPILGMGGEAWGAAEGAAGSAEGAQSPFDMAAIATDKIKDNTADIAEQVDGIALAADGVTKAFDDAAAPRTMQITVETIDKTGGLLKAILGGLQGGSIQLGTGGSVRDNGGRIAGQDNRVPQRAGVAS